MSIDHTSETLIQFSQASKSIPGNPAICTIHRWRLSGVRGQKLETILIGGLRYTSHEAIGRFIAAQNAPESRIPGITAGQRSRQAETANRLLAEAGL